MSFNDVYQLQYGGGGRGVSNVFVGAQRQRGHGLGSFFTGLFRSALPFLSRGALAVGKEALRAGVNILDDVTENNMSFKDSFKSRMNEGGNNLKRKATEKIHKFMEGGGYKALKRKRSTQSRRRSGSRRIVSAKKGSKVSKRKQVKKKYKTKTTKRRNKKTKRS